MSTAIPHRILIVDDEAPLMEALRSTLRTHGFETTGFTSPNHALAALQSSTFDLLLADLMMPEMDGIALLQAAQAADPNLVGIIMTGEGTIATAVEAMKIGALDYILKPFKLSFILPVLNRALSIRCLRMDNAELHQRLVQRTAELEAANQELEAFTYSVSHDLRAPLRAVRGFSSILSGQFASHLPEEATNLLADIEQNAGRMNQLIEDLLRLSRLGRQALTRVHVNLDMVVREAVEEIKLEYKDSRVDVHVAELGDGLGDRSLLKQVFVNLISNAFKFTRDRERPTVEVGCDLRNGEKVYFVRDNGAGFDMGYADRLFGVFQRLHTQVEFPGTGIGLTIVQRIVRRHGGRVWAQAEPGKGATFYFVLPEG